MEGGPVTPTKSGNAGGLEFSIIRRSSADSLSAPAASASRQSLTSPSTTSLATSISSVKEEEEKDSAQRNTEAVVAKKVANAAKEVADAAKEVANAAKPAEIVKSESSTVTAAFPVEAAPPLPPRPESPGGYEIPDTPLAVMRAESKRVKEEPLEPPKQTVVESVEPEIPAGYTDRPNGTRRDCLGTLDTITETT